MKPGIFISYRRSDEGFARQLATALSLAGADIWIDIEDIPAGMNWGNAIQEGLDQSQLLLLIVTPESMASPNVQEEWQYYKDQGKPIIPILLKPAKIHFQLSRLQYIDFHAHEFSKAFGQLVAEIARKGISLGSVTLPPAVRPPVMNRTKQIAAVVGVVIAILVGGLALLNRPPAPEDNLTVSVTPFSIDLKSRQRPLFPGLSASSVEQTGSSIGAFVCDEDGAAYLFTSPVMNDEAGTAFIQPGPIDGGDAIQDVIGELFHLSGLSFSANSVGLVRLDDGIQFSANIPSFGTIKGVRDPQVGMKVIKLGRTTAFTEGEISEINRSITLILAPEEATALVGVAISSKMSSGGDGGALVLDKEGYAVGLVVGGSDTQTIIAPVGALLDAFNVTLIYSGGTC